MEIKKKDLQRNIETMLSKKYKSRLGDAGFITFFRKNFHKRSIKLRFGEYGRAKSSFYSRYELQETHQRGRILK